MPSGVYKRTEEARKNIGLAKKGKTLSAEHRKKISMSGIGNKNGFFGGRATDTFGYVLIFSPNHPNKTSGNYVLEHRLVMEQHIGRYLTRKEVVHHINGIKDDNRLENLMLFSNNAEHVKHHRELERTK